jgi:DNA primase catalytic core
MEVQHMSYPEAIKYLAKKYNITIDEKSEPLTAEERDREHKREAMFIANKYAAEFYASQLQAADEKASFAKKYAYDRWGEKFCIEEGIGFSPGNGKFRAFAKEKGLSTELLLELGLLRKNEKQIIYDGFYGRVVIPIRDKYGNYIAFSARNLTNEKPKYINSPESLVYSKQNSIFGIHTAMRQGAKDECFYLVEGGPDVLKLQSVGIANTIASLGTAWTKNQFAMLKRFNPRLCFIPDIDTPKDGAQFGAGIMAVMRNGLEAINEGFNVTVKEIAKPEGEDKVDPDSFIHSRAALSSINEEDFILWYATKLITGKETTGDRSEVIKKVSKLVAQVGDRIRQNMYISQLAKIFGTPKSLMQNAVNDATKGNVERKRSNEKLIDQELYQKYGFYERNNCYIALGKDGIEDEWSNFVLTPLFHIKDQLNPKRLFRIKNVNRQEEIVELKQEDLVSLAKFKLRIEGIGNYIWKAKEEQLTKLKGFLYEKTETAVEITQLGWQQDGFFAFGNGVFFNGGWLKTDDYGIVRLGEIGNFYLPSSSQLYRNERKLFQFERRFVHATLSEITFRQYTDKMIEVFGNNAKVGICFLLATLFKDVVTATTKTFPILNLFGPKGSGKSELGHTLMSFFIAKNEPPNLSSATDAALADTVAQCANALVHLDEYKNSIELSRREFLKGLYDGVGRTRMNMDRDKKRETTSVDCGIILSGQEMPTIDIAIFSRLLFLTFPKSEFSTEAKHKFDELKTMRDMGCSHLVLELLKHRKRVEVEFSANYKTAMSDIIASINTDGVEDRILRNWVIPLAIFRTLAGVIDVAFDYKEMLSICCNGIERQNGECRSTNELATFWQVVDFLHQDGSIYIDADYRIVYSRDFKGKGQREKIIFPAAKPVLYLCTNRVFMLYKKNGKMVGDATLPTESLRFYLENSKEYLGTKTAVRFKNINNSPDATTVEKNADGHTIVKNTSRVEQALAFDYEMLARNYNITLEVDCAPDDEPDPINIDTEDKTKPY